MHKNDDPVDNAQIVRKWNKPLVAKSICGFAAIVTELSLLLRWLKR